MIVVNDLPITSSTTTSLGPTPTSMPFVSASDFGAFSAEGFSAVQLKLYAQVCGWTLARAHAKSGDAATISGYLGKSDTFDRALSAFAVAYADQTQKDHAVLVKAIRSGRVQALAEE